MSEPSFLGAVKLIWVPSHVATKATGMEQGLQVKELISLLATFKIASIIPGGGGAGRE